MTTVGEAERRLATAGVASARHDARALAAFLTGRQIALAAEEPGAAYDDLVARRARREPLQHIVGSVGFRSVEVAVGPGVFVPRPETESVAGAAIALARPRAEAVVVDLCAGSGAIALAVADEVAGARVYAVEREQAAFGWLERNVAGSPVVAVRADAGVALPELDGTVDVVVSNPPYLPDGLIVEPEVGEHDPPAALWGGPDGLAALRVVAARAAALLRPGGWFVAEHADDQGEAVPALLAEATGWAQIADHPDLTGRPRYTTARRDRCARCTPAEQAARPENPRLTLAVAPESPDFGAVRGHGEGQGGSGAAKSGPTRG